MTSLNVFCLQCSIKAIRSDFLHYSNEINFFVIILLSQRKSCDKIRLKQTSVEVFIMKKTSKILAVTLAIVITINLMIT